MRLLRFIPLLILPLLAYAVLWALSGASVAQRLAAPIATIPLASGDVWAPTLGAMLTIVAVVCLFFEIIRSAAPSAGAIGENIATALVFIPCLALFLLVRGFGTSEFFLIMLLLLLDFLTDSTVMVFTSRRTVEYSRS